MRYITAFFFLLFVNLTPVLAQENTLELALQKIESQWARIYYDVTKEQQEFAYQQLLAKVKNLNAQYPNQAELIIQQAIIVASNADNIAPFSALEAVHQARDLLLRAIELDPHASAGAAFVTLGSLYYMVPGWPIAFGDNDKAQSMLKKALAIDPNTIDANYFYGDFLATQGKQQQAVAYFKRALAIPPREKQLFADTQLHNLAKLAIKENSQVLASNRLHTITITNF